MSTLDVDELVEQAKLAEQAERYDDMAKVKSYNIDKFFT